MFHAYPPPRKMTVKGEGLTAQGKLDSSGNGDRAGARKNVRARVRVYKGFREVSGRFRGGFMKQKIKNKGGRPTKEEAERKRADQAFREGLIAQLTARKADTPFFIETVNEIMYLRGQLRELKALISENGILTVRAGRNGAERYAVNEVLREIRDTEKTIMMMLKELKITTDNIIPEDEDDEL